MTANTDLITAAREALGQRLADASLLRPTSAEETEARSILSEVIDGWNRDRVSFNHEAVSQAERTRLQNWLFDLFFRMGPIQPFLDEDAVEEVTVNGPSLGFVIRAGGVKERVELGFRSDEDLRTFISRVVARSGRRIDDASPSVDVRLPGGARLHAMLPPIARHVSITIRRHRLVAETIDELIGLGTVDDDAARFLAQAVKSRINLLVSGGTASGKTTTLNALGRMIPEEERVVTIEETSELRLADLLSDCIALEARPPNSEGVGEVSIRELVRHALRMRPNRVIVGEVRGPEALDMISAMNSGHEGSMGTIHANDARQALAKLRSYLLMAKEEIPAEVAAEMIAETIQLVIHLRLDASGKRRIVQIAEVVGIDGNAVLTNDVFRIEGDRLVRSGVRTKWIEIPEVRVGQAAANNGGSQWDGIRS